MKAKKGIQNGLPLFIQMEQTRFILDIGREILSRTTGVVYNEIGNDIDEIMDQVEAEELMKQGKLR
jgi:hypothetical protein